MFVHIYYLFWSQSPPQVQFKVQLLQIWGSLPHVGTCDNQGLGWTKLARRLARAQRRQILTMQTQVGGRQCRYTQYTHTHKTYTRLDHIYMHKSIQNLVNMVKMLFDDLKQFVFQWRASQPTSTYFSYHKFTRRISQVCINVSCIVVTRVSEGGGLKPNCSSGQDSCVESSQSLAASRLPGVEVFYSPHVKNEN